MDNPKEKFFTLTDNLFTFSSLACDCVTDIENIKPGVIRETVKMQSLPNKPVRFAFAPNRGMVRLADTGTINSDHVLTDLLAIPEGNKKALFDFLSEYGFFFPISTSTYEAVDIDLLYGIVNRVRAVVNLMSSISEAKKNYKKILGLVLFLQLSRPIEIIVSCFEQPFSTCEHPIFTEMDRASSLPQTGNPVASRGLESYTMSDTIFCPSFELSIADYSNIIGGFAGAPVGSGQSQMFKDVTRLYCNAPNLPDELRRVIDFLFHYQHSIAVIKSYSADGSVEYFDSEANVKTRYSSNFNDTMKRALLDIAKIAIRDEIGYNIGGMRPQYDIDTMSPSWEIQDFLTGIYVSIFFMRPEVELYRKCANPSCDRMFLVNTTSAKRKYCSSPCRNAAAQRAHRLRKQAIN